MDGSTHSLLTLISGLVANGVNVCVAGPNGDIINKKISVLGAKYYPVKIVRSIYPASDDTWKSKIKIVRLCRYAKKWICLPPKKLISYFEICKIIKTVNPDIVHTNTGVVREGFWAAKRYNIPHVWHLREYQDKEYNRSIYPCKRIFERMLCCSYVITITDDLRKHFNLLNSPKSITIYNGISYSKHLEFRWPKKKQFLCASRIVPYKGHNRVIQAFAKFYRLHPDYHLVILGFGQQDWIEKLKRQAQALGCEKAVRWEGYKEDVFEYMSDSMGLIVASTFEGFGRMTAEACFAGCLPIGMNNSGTKEIIEKTGGFLFDTEDELFSQMQVVSSLSKERYRCLISRAQNISSNLFSIEQNIDNTFSFYNRIIVASR